MTLGEGKHILRQVAGRLGSSNLPQQTHEYQSSAQADTRLWDDMRLIADGFDWTRETASESDIRQELQSILATCKTPVFREQALSMLTEEIVKKQKMVLALKSLNG